MKTTKGRHSLRSPALALLLGTAAVASTWSGSASAAPSQAAQGAPSPSATVTPAEHAAAQAHFKKAKELYQTGAYHEAATELEAALALDPNARELIFNLGVVDERLGRIDDALSQFHRYQTLDLSSAERSRSDAYIRRLEGAKKAQAPAPPPPAPAVAPVVPPPHPQPPVEAPPPSPSHGRVDAASVTPFVIGGAGIVGGAVFGVLALTTRPSNYLTGTGGQTYASYQDATDSYHRDATVSTVALAVGGAAIALSAILFFARTNDPADGTTPTAAAIALDPLVHGMRF